jgi:hypothetical protein
MLSYLMIGANDVSVSSRFYTEILLPMGYEKHERKGAVIFPFPDIPDRFNGPGSVYIARPFDGRPATVGNGIMPAFRTKTRAEVRTLHAAGLVAGGMDEGAPGFRAEYSKNFYVAYLRDPVGNKLALFCTTPDE